IIQRGSHNLHVRKLIVKWEGSTIFEILLWKSPPASSGFGRSRCARSRTSRDVLWCEIYRFALFQRIRGIDDNAIRRLNTFEHFQGIAEITPDRELLETDSVVGADDRGHGSIGAEQKRVNRQGNALTR